MLCNRCGTENGEDVKFCKECGASLIHTENPDVLTSGESDHESIRTAGGGHEVFISYSTKNKNVADAIVADFEQHGIKCWYAPRDIFPGQEWVSAIKSALEAARVLILIFTGEANDSRQVMNEVALAFNAGKTIVPFRLTEDVMNNELEYYLTRVHWLDAVSKPLSKNITQLREYIGVILNKPQDTTAVASSASSHEETAKKQKLSVKKIIIGLVAVCILIALIGAVNSAIRKPAKEEEETGSDKTETEAVAADTEETETAEDNEEAEESVTEDTVDFAEEHGGEVETGSCGQNTTWTFTQDGSLIIQGVGAMDDYDSTDNRAPWHSYYDLIKSITVDDGVTVIGTYAFSGCSLAEKIELPDSLIKINNRAFFGCSALESIEIPANVLEIGNACFSGGLPVFTEIKVSAGNKNYVSEAGVLFDADRSTLICYPEGKEGDSYIVPATVRTIAMSAFENSKLKEIRLPDSLESLEDYAFWNCSGLTSIKIPEKVNKIGLRVFSGLGTDQSKFVIEFAGDMPATMSANPFDNKTGHFIARYDAEKNWPEDMISDKQYKYEGDLSWRYISDDLEWLRGYFKEGDKDFVYAASLSAEGTDVMNAFDGDRNTKWVVDLGQNSVANVCLSYGEAFVAKRIIFTNPAGGDYVPDRFLSGFELQGYDEAEKRWVSICNWSNIKAEENISTYSYLFSSNTNAYKSYNLKITGANNGNMFQIADIELKDTEKDQ